MAQPKCNHLLGHQQQSTSSASKKMDTNRLIEQNTIIVEEKVTIFANQYTLYDTEGRLLGTMKEHRSPWRFVLKRAFAPFNITCFDNEQRPLATMQKSWAFLAPKYTIRDNNGSTIGLIRSKVTLVTPKAEFFDAQEQIVGTLTGNWTAWDFNITAPNGSSLATINKQFNGFMKEMFTTADKYRVHISDDIKDLNLRIAIIFAASAIDMIFKEQ